MADENTESGSTKRPNEMDEAVQYWLDEIQASKRREKDFRKNGTKIRQIYDGSMAEKTPFNILYSNTETMAPALYSTVPRPVVQRRFKDDDPVGKAGAVAAQRMLEFLLDTNVDGYDTFDAAMKSATNDALLPGRGVTAAKYDAEIADADGTEVVTSELVCTDIISWDRVFFGYAKKWSKVPWMALELHLDKEAATRKFGAEIAGKIEYTQGEDIDEEEGKTRSEIERRDMGERETALCYQIWDKDDRKLRYVSPQYKDGFLLVDEDPLSLTGFFPVPKPLTFIEKSNDLVPVSPYKLYEKQANELNRLTIRINKIAEAIKARGIYDSELGGDIANVIKGDDNVLVPSEKGSSLAAEKGLGNAIWMLPIEQLVVVHEKLLVAREQAKQTIYEITGISDILRGATKASETLGAQKLKSQWGTLRIKPKQAEVQRYARDLLRIMLEIAAKKFSEDTWAKMTGLPYLTSQQVEQIKSQMAAMQQMANGNPAAQQNPAMLQQAQQLLQQAQQPKWGQVLAVLKDDIQRSYKIDIETNSTIEPEAVEDQKNISDLMTALGQFLQGVSPLVEKGVMPFEVAQSMMIAITRRYRFGTEIEDFLKQMKQPPPQGDNGEAAKKDLQAQQQIAQLNARILELQQQLSAERVSKELDNRKQDLDLQEASLQAEKELFDLQKTVTTEHFSMIDKHVSESTQHRERLAGMVESRSKEAQANASRADAKVGTAVNSIKQTEQKVDQTRNDVLQVIAAQGAATQAMVMELVKAIHAPRVRVPVRGADGRISHIVDQAGDSQTERTN